MSTNTTAGSSALWRHVQNLYDRMAIEADEDGIWEGKLTALVVNEMHLSLPYYTSLTRALKTMGCIAQIKRGGGGSKSQWKMIRPPTVQEFETLVADSGGKITALHNPSGLRNQAVYNKRYVQTKEGQREQRERDQNDRITSLETEIRNLKLVINAVLTKAGLEMEEM